MVASGWEFPHQLWDEISISHLEFSYTLTTNHLQEPKRTLQQTEQDPLLENSQISVSLETQSKQK